MTRERIQFLGDALIVSGVYLQGRSPKSIIASVFNKGPRSDSRKLVAQETGSLFICLAF